MGGTSQILMDAASAPALLDINKFGKERPVP